MRLRVLAAAGVAVLLAACSDRNDLPTTPRGGSAHRTVTPTGSLDQNITILLSFFPKGLQTAGSARWTDVKRKYAAGQLDVAKKMLFELAQWVKDKAPDMDAPPNDETKSAAAARLTLYMSMYVFGSPSTPVPVYTPSADATVGLVTPDQPATIVTPLQRAGVGMEAGTVAEASILVITENPTPYPDACSGQLQTKLCQYPRFYDFTIFP